MVKKNAVEACEFCAGITVSYETITKRKVVHCPRCLYRKHWEDDLGWVIDEWPTCPQCGMRLTGVDQGHGAGYEIKCPKCGDSVIDAGAVAGPETKESGKVINGKDQTAAVDLFSEGAKSSAAVAEAGEIPAEIPLPKEGEK